MKEYLFYFISCALFVLMYKMIVIHGRKKTYMFFVFIQLLIILLGINVYFVDIGAVAGVVVIEIAFLIFVKNYKNNIERNKIYEIIASSVFVPIMFTGINNLEAKNHQKMQKTFERLFNREREFKGKIFLIISYNEEKLIVRYLFGKQEDYELYISWDVLDKSNISNLEKNGKGISFIYTCDI